MGIKKKIKNIIYKLKFLNNLSQYNEIKNKNILITGANSGIGFELVKNLVQGNKIIATFNTSSENLFKISNQNLEIVKCDFSKNSEFEKLKSTLKKYDINLIINNACYPGKKNQYIFDLDFDDFYKAIDINVFSCLKILRILNELNKLDQLHHIINISSETGSISLNNSGGRYIYRLTKSMLNSLTKNLSVDMNKNFKTKVISVHPGSVKTKLNPEGLVSPKLSATKIIKLLKSDYNGCFISIPGMKKINW